jgi:hypothetical protein
LDLTVSLSGGKTFGKYASGDIIPSTGKTPAEVISMAIVEAINPTVSLTSVTTIAYNQTVISNSLNLSYTINSLGATVASASLQWRRNGTGAWTTLSTSSITPTTYIHAYTDTNFNSTPFNYQYIITDSVGAYATGSKTITPTTRQDPSVSLTVAGVSVTSPETNSKREKGNVNTTLSGTVTRNSPNVALQTYTLQYQVNGGSWSDISSSVSIGPGTSTITSTNHNPTGDITANSLGYRVKVVDAYYTSISSFYTSATSTVSFLNMIFTGSTSLIPSSSAEIRSFGGKMFTDAVNPFNLLTGNTYNNFTVAMPVALSITEVLDLDALNANITSLYLISPISPFYVNDYGGTATSYHIYTNTIASPYGTNHRHQITRA